MHSGWSSCTFFKSDGKSKFSRDEDFTGALCLFLNLQEIKKRRHLSKCAERQESLRIRKSTAVFENFKKNFDNLSLTSAENLFGIRIYAWWKRSPLAVPECWREGSDDSNLARLDLLCTKTGQKNIR